MRQCGGFENEKFPLQKAYAQGVEFQTSSEPNSEPQRSLPEAPPSLSLSLPLGPAPPAPGVPPRPPAIGEPFRPIDFEYLRVFIMYVIKRDGRHEQVHFDKITSRISKLAYGLNPDFCDPVRLLVVSSSSCSCGIFPCFLSRLLLIRLFV